MTDFIGRRPSPKKEGTVILRDIPDIHKVSLQVNELVRRVSGSGHESADRPWGQ